MPDITGCNGIVAVYSPSVAGHGYEWYVGLCESYVFPLVSCNTLTYRNTANALSLSNQAENHPQGLYLVQYEDYLNGVYQCTSNTFSVNVFNTQVNIVSTSSTLPATLGVELLGADLYAGITGYQWYRNNRIIQGATSRYYHTRLAGNYHVVVSSNICGPRSSNTASFACGASNYSNYTFPTGNTQLTGNIVFEGKITIPSNAKVTITNAQVMVKSCTEIIILPDNTKSYPNEGGVLTLNNTALSGCGKWNGINVQGDNYNGIGSVYAGHLIATESIIADADNGVYADKDAEVYIENDTFTDNYQHIHFNGINGYAPIPPYGQDIVVKNSVFYALTDNTSGCSPSIAIPTMKNSSIRKMLYINDFVWANLTGNKFYPELTGQSRYNVIETHLGRVVSNPHSLVIDESIIQGTFENGVYIVDADNIKMTGNMIGVITGDFKQGINLINSSTSNSQIHLIELYKIIETTGNNVGTGIRSDEMDVMEIKNCEIKECGTGIEIYTKSRYNSQIKIEHNTIWYNTYGVVIAPQCSPLVNCNSNLTNYSDVKNISLVCDKIFYNDYGIIGVGDWVDQGDANDEWSTFFDYQPQSTTNNYADIVWYSDNIVSGIKPKLFYSNINNNNSFEPIFLQNTNLTIDGYNVGYGNYLNEIDFTGINNKSACNGSYINETGILIIHKKEHINLYPNPTQGKSELINNSLVELSHIEIYSGMGIKLYTGKEIDLSNYPFGIYQIIVYGVNGNIYSGTLIHN